MNPTSPGPRTLDQFGTPHGDFMPDVAEFDRMFRAVEMTLVPQVPKDVRMRIQTARNLGVYAGFSYDLSAVSAYWSITCTKFHLEVITRSVHTTVARSHTTFIRSGTIFIPILRWDRACPSSAPARGRRSSAAPASIELSVAQYRASIELRNRYLRLAGLVQRISATPMPKGEN
jgi:hypothetical protein